MLVCAVLHPGGWNHTGLSFASGTQNFTVSARQAGVKGEDENHHIF